MRYLLQHAGQCGHVHPLTGIARGAVDAVVDTERTGMSHGIGVDQPARAMSPQHQSVVACGRIAAYGILQHGLHHLRVAGVFVLRADAHIG